MDVKELREKDFHPLDPSLDVPQHAAGTASSARAPEEGVPERVSGQLRVLTQNMFAHYFIRGCNDKDERMRGLLKCLKDVARDVDVVLMQEIFVGKIGPRDLGGDIVQEVVREAHKLGFLHHARGKDPKQLLLGQNNGLLILSRFPFKGEPEEFTFKNRSETVCAKGVLKVVLDVDGAEVHVITSHLDSRGPEIKRLQLMEVRSMFPPLVDDRGNAANIILTGDLNVDALGNRGSKHDYTMLLNIMAPAGEVVDLWAGVHQVTCEEDNAHLDYIFASPHMIPQQLEKSRRIEHFTRTGLNNSQDMSDAISDHWGLSCTLYAHGTGDTPVGRDELELSGSSTSITVDEAVDSPPEDRTRMLKDQHVHSSTIGLGACPSAHHIPMLVHSKESPFMTALEGDAMESVHSWQGRSLYACLSRGPWKVTGIFLHNGVLYGVGREVRRFDVTKMQERSGTAVSTISSCKASVFLPKQSRISTSGMATEAESYMVLVATTGLHLVDLISMRSSDLSSLRSRLAGSSWQHTRAFVVTMHGEVFAFCRKLYHIRNLSKDARPEYTAVGEERFGNVCGAVMLPTTSASGDADERCIVSTDNGALWDVNLNSGKYVELVKTDDPRSALRAMFTLEHRDDDGEVRHVLFGFADSWLCRVSLEERGGKPSASMQYVCHASFGCPRASVVDTAHTGRHRVFIATDICLASLLLPENLFG